jgi:hypothetical protein
VNETKNPSGFNTLPERNQQLMPKQSTLPLAPFVFHSAAHTWNIKTYKKFVFLQKSEFA